MKRQLKTIALASLSGFVLFSSLAATLSWFATQVKIDNFNVTGHSAGAYFAYGNGKKANDENPKDRPYGISHPRHLYNLAWLQYKGIFNKDANNDGTIDQQYYFEIDPTLTTELDMSDWTLPPIGTEDNPFLGTFNGNNKVITNLTVSNESNITKPDNITYNVYPEVIGFFGVIGDLPNENTSSRAAKAKNFTLKNTTIKSVTSQVLIGIRI